MDWLTFRDSFNASFDHILDNNVLDNDILNNKIYISLLINPFFLAQSKNLNTKSIINFNIIQLSVFYKLNIDKL